MGVPSSVRPHLRWIMRCLLILRVPSILANLLSCRLEMHGELEADGKELNDRSTTAEALSDAVHALFYVSAPNDASRVRCVLLSLWDAELRRHLQTVAGGGHDTGAHDDGGAIGTSELITASSASLSALRAAAVGMHPSCLFCQLLRSHLQRVPAARAFLHESCRLTLEAYLDHAGHAPHASMGESGAQLYAAGWCTKLLTALETNLTGSPCVLKKLALRIVSHARAFDLDAPALVGGLLIACYVGPSIRDPRSHGIHVLGLRSVRDESAILASLSEALLRAASSAMGVRWSVDELADAMIPEPSALQMVAVDADGCGAPPRLQAVLEGGEANASLEQQH